MKMTEKQLIEQFLEMQEHPEQMSDEQLKQVLEDKKMRELVEQVAFAKRAYKNEELKGQECDVEDEWSRFANKHFDEESDTMRNFQSRKILGIAKRQRRAASFIGLVIISGIAFAAIHFVRMNSEPVGGDLKSPTQEMQISNPHQQMATTDTVEKDTTTTTTHNPIQEPIVFDNVRLDEMLPKIASYYHTEVMFQNEAARELRFHFVWKQEDGLEHAIEKLNRFESLTIRLEKGDGEHQSTKIIVE